jgi:P-type Cu2+ transporter
MVNRTVVLHVGGLHWATSAPSVEAKLLRRPGVVSVAVNAANQTATVTYDPRGHNRD